MRLKPVLVNHTKLFGALLVAAVLIADGSRAAQVDVEWDGGNSGNYNDTFHWLPRVVPTNGNGGNTYRVTVDSQGPYLDIDATVDALTLEGNSFISVSSHSFTSAFTRNDTAPFAYTKDYVGIQGVVANGNGKADLGVLANYDAATQTLRGGSYLATGYSSGASISFKGARIVTNAAGIRLGIDGKLTDEFGNDALEFLAINDGLLDLTNFQTAGDFTNNGVLNLISHDVAPRLFVVTGNLTNFDPKTKTLTGGSYVFQDPGFNGVPRVLQFRGADIVTNAADIYVARTRDGTPSGAPCIIDEHGNDALRNFANNAAGGRITFADPDFTTTVARITNAGYMYIGRRFTLPVNGSYEQTDGELVLNLGSGSSGGFKGILDTQGGSIFIHGGLVTGGGRLIGTTTNAGIIAPGTGDLTPLTTFDGNLTLGSSSILRFDIAGTARGPGVSSSRFDPFARQYGYDAIDSTGSVVIDGQLQVSLSTATKSGLRFIPASSDTFVLLKSATPILGSFRNVANGQRLRTTDGGGSFLVNYGPNTAFDLTAVVLSDFQPNTGPATLLNISTRGQVGSGESVLIGGFIVTGSEPKPIITRGIGPSLRSSGVTSVVNDPVLHLHDRNGTVIASNDDWQQSSQRTDIQATGIPPSDSREAAIVATLLPGNYTAVLEAKNGAGGVALVEIYDLDAGRQSQLANISTRGYAGSGDDALIGGMIVAGGTGNTDVVVRALGPSLAGAGVTEPLSDPYLYIKDQNGNPVDSNDNWKTNEAAIRATGIPPSNDLESAIARTLQPGSYTAVVQPAINYLANPPTPTNSGAGLVEFYRLR
jgi:hypothetical protein